MTFDPNLPYKTINLFAEIRGDQLGFNNSNVRGSIVRSCSIEND